ncbi:MAG: amphi-Trp domain-containing protein [Natronomonas sp.]
MTKEVDFPSNQTEDTTTITDGFFEREVRLSSDQTVEFLRTLADVIDDGDGELLVSGDDWEIPFEYTDPVEVEVEFSGGTDRELEIEFEFEDADDDDRGIAVE